MRTFVHDRWFPLIEIGLILFAGFVWFVGANSLTIEPLFIALIPWGMRIGAGDRPFRRTKLDGFVLLFVLTAAISIFFAYNTHLASVKFFILLTAVLLFYGLIGQSRRDIWWLTSGLSVLAVGIVLYFIMTNDWNVFPADINLINELGLRWMQIRPSLPIPLLHANAAGGILAMILPFQAALFIYGRQAGNRLLRRMAMATGGVSLFGLLFTSSRGAWGALLLAGLIWGAWVLSKQVGEKWQRPSSHVFGLFMVLLFGFLAIVWLVFSDRLLASSTLSSRLLLDKASLELLFDYPFLGAGLAGFGGLYSQYVAVVPFFEFNYGHFFWFDVILEQGVLALLGWMGIYAGALWFLSQAPGHEIYVNLRTRKIVHKPKYVSDQPLKLGLFRWAIMMSMITLFAHSLIDDTLYAFLGMPLLFLLPGLCLLLAKEQSAAGKLKLRDIVGSRVFMVGGGVLAVIIIAAVIYRRPVMAHWHATRGAAQMARVELQGWPRNAWDTGKNVAALEPAASYFEQALTIDPLNRTAHHRLGLIAMLNRDYETAVFHLEAAHQIDPDHRGIVKNLGYSYVWLGEYDKAMLLLADIQESYQEMDEYSRWWQLQERPDLANRAAEMSRRLS